MLWQSVAVVVAASVSLAFEHGVNKDRETQGRCKILARVYFPQVSPGTNLLTNPKTRMTFWGRGSYKATVWARIQT